MRKKRGKKSKVMAQANEKDKDQGGRLRPQGLRVEENQGRCAFLSFFCLSFFNVSFRGISRKVQGIRSPVRKTRFFSSRLDRTKERATARRSCIELVEFGFPSRRNSDESSGEVITVMRPVDIFFMGERRRLRRQTREAKCTAFLTNITRAISLISNCV